MGNDFESEWLTLDDCRRIYGALFGRLAPAAMTAKGIAEQLATRGEDELKAAMRRAGVKLDIGAYGA
jgi:hypothetical protein